MRYVRDLIILTMLLIIAAGVHWYQKTQAAEERTLQHAVDGLRLLQQEVRLKAATRESDLNSRGWPMTIDPRWFPAGAPRNMMVDANRPWVELARPEEAALQHPPIRMTIDRSLAGFWYNPYQGVVRARVPVMVSDEESRDLYNELNECHLVSIFWIEEAPMNESEVASARRDAAQAATTDAVNNFTPSDPTTAESQDLDPTKPLPEDAPNDDGSGQTPSEIATIDDEAFVGPPAPGDSVEQATVPADEE